MNVRKKYIKDYKAFLSKKQKAKSEKAARLGRNRSIYNANMQIQRYLKECGLVFEFPMKKAEAICIYSLYVGVIIPDGQSKDDWLLEQYHKKELPGLNKPLPKKNSKRKKDVGFKDKIELYKIYLKTKTWKDKREELFALRGKKCETCGATKNIQVHHLHYRNIFKEKMEDLQVLCGKCHKAVHDITKDNPKGNTKGIFLKKKRRKK